jgi:5-methyltetrahydrofolate--homocysteine methyltransferase
MALLCDDTGIPKTAADRIRVLNNIMAKAKEYGIKESRIHIDPLIEMLCTAEDGIAMVLEVMDYIKEHYPQAHISGAVSNISFNLPYRKIVNQAFTVVCIQHGMDSGIFDPLNRDLRGSIYAAEALSGEDYYCMEYVSAFREGIFGPQDKK